MKLLRLRQLSKKKVPKLVLDEPRAACQLGRSCNRAVLPMARYEPAARGLTPGTCRALWVDYDATLNPSRRLRGLAARLSALDTAN